LVIVAAMLVETVMSLAAPWPLKAIIDNVAGSHPPPKWIDWLLPMLGGDSKVHIAEAAGIVTVLIAVVTGAAMYAASYFTERMGQRIGSDLRVRLYHHLQELSLAYYDTTRVGTILSTLTGDVETIQRFASASTLNIFTDTLTLVGMVIVMFWLRWDFALIALAVAPPLAFFVLHVSKAIRTAVHELRIHQSELVSTLQEGLQSMVVVQLFRRGRQEHRVRKANMANVTAWLRVQGVYAAYAGGQPGDRGVYGSGVVAGLVADRGGHDDAGHADCVSLLPGRFSASARACPDDYHDRACVGGFSAGACGQ
jgi:subfamily B ATP-binding cassette protein MsbA